LEGRGTLWKNSQRVPRLFGWMVAAHENARLAQRLIEATCVKQGITPHQLIIHADRRAPMRSNSSPSCARTLASTPAIRGRA